MTAVATTAETHTQQVPPAHSPREDDDDHLSSENRHPYRSSDEYDDGPESRPRPQRLLQLRSQRRRDSSNRGRSGPPKPSSTQPESSASEPESESKTTGRFLEHYLRFDIDPSGKEGNPDRGTEENKRNIDDNNNDDDDDKEEKSTPNPILELELNFPVEVELDARISGEFTVVVL